MNASLAIVNGTVWSSELRATALAVTGERITAVGADDDIRTLIGSDTQVLDARGGTILPAFNDAHIHFLMGSRGLGDLDLFGAETQADVERRIREFGATNRRPWLIARGWFYSAFPGGIPSLELLDQLVPDRPAYLESFDTHTAWVNSKALAMAGSPPSSSPGTLKEAAMDGFQRHLPKPTREEDLDALRTGMALAASKGIASIQEASRGLDQVSLYEALRESGELTLRVRLAFDMTPGHTMDEWEQRLDVYAEASRAGAWISTGIVKAFADGVIESRTASLIEPYAGLVAGEPGAFGEPLWEPRELAEAVRIASRRGWQVQVHAIGDRAIHDALDAFATTDRSRRHRVEHIEAPAAEDIARFGELGVIASMQPQHAEPNHNLMQAWAPNLGPERAALGFPWASIARAGGRLAFGTDWPVVPLDPIASLRTAVTRQTPGGDPPGGWLPHERITLDDAIAGWTSGAANAERMQDEKGALRVGMLADIAVLDRDIARTPSHQITRIKVEATVVGGRLVYER